MTWLEYHSSDAGVAEASPAWLVSLATLATLLTALDITGSEDLGVWNDVRMRWGRRLDADADTSPIHAEVVDGIRNLWSYRDSIVELLNPELRDLVKRHAEPTRAGAAAWRAGYFDRAEAVVGPRAGAAVYAIFHWNRGMLSTLDQALVAEALARPADR